MRRQPLTEASVFLLIGMVLSVHANGTTVFQAVPSLERTALQPLYDNVVAFGYSVGPPASPSSSQLWCIAAFCTLSGVIPLLPFLAAVFSAWMNMSADAYPMNMPVSTFLDAPGS